MNDEFELALAEAAEPTYVGGKLVAAVATLFRLTYTAQAMHWNVSGADFQQLHALFGEAYETAYELIDDVAEQARQLGTMMPSTLDGLLNAATFEEPASATDVRTRTASLAGLFGSAKQRFDEIALLSPDDAGLVDLMGKASSALSKMAWKLRMAADAASGA